MGRIYWGVWDDECDSEKGLYPSLPVMLVSFCSRGSSPPPPVGLSFKKWLPGVPGLSSCVSVSPSYILSVSVVRVLEAIPLR